MWDAEGDRYLDFFGGILTTMTGARAAGGHRRRSREQAGKILHTSTLYLIRPMVELAEEIAGLVGHPRRQGLLHDVGHARPTTPRCCCAVATAGPTRSSRCATATTAGRSPRSRITGNRGWSPTSLIAVPDLLRARRQPLPQPVRAVWRTPSSSTRASTDLREVHRHQDGRRRRLPDRRADPGRRRVHRTGPTGCSAPFAEGARRAPASCGSATRCRPGWGRTGEHFWGWQAHADGGATPDIVTFAKGIGNGLSVGGVIARAEIMDCLRGNSISTFGGSPITAAGALANLRYLLAHDLQGNAAKVGPILLDGLRELELADRRRRPRQGPDDRRRAGPAAHGIPRRTGARAGERRAGGDEAARAAGRQGRPVRQRAAHRATADAHRGGGGRGAGPAHRVDRGSGGGRTRVPRPSRRRWSHHDGRWSAMAW